MITDVAAGTVTILIAETKEARVITIPPDQRRRPVPSNRPSPEVLEETTIGGHRVSKARMQGSQGQRAEFWTAKDLGVVTWTKTEAAGMTTTKELRNLSTQEPSRAMFAIPADYTVIEQEARPGNGRLFIDGRELFVPFEDFPWVQGHLGSRDYACRIAEFASFVLAGSRCPSCGRIVDASRAVSARESVAA